MKLPNLDPIKFQRKNFGKELFDKALAHPVLQDVDIEVTSDNMMPEAAALADE
jgi:hypothetical protein